MAEILALQKALISTFNCGRDSLIFSDSQIFINLINNHLRNLEIAEILNDIYFLSQFFNFIQFNFILRTANVLADSVPKKDLGIMTF